ncbi:MAG: hypothetical protein M0Z31_02905 [Clostridia bacterium]|nr:hypothetical protein [Clostridia bacterium]
MTKKPVIKAIISDPNGSPIDINTITLLVNNNKVVPEIVYQPNGPVTVTYASDSLANNSHHQVSLTAADSHGNSSSVNWRFYGSLIGTTTGFTNQYPVNQTVYSTTPLISAHFSNLEGNYLVHMANIKVNGYTPQITVWGEEGYYYTDKPPEIFGAHPEYTLSYTPQPLRDGIHTAAFTVYDSDGNPSSTQWNFTVDTKIGTDYPDMPVKNDATCWSCHKGDVPANGGIHPEAAKCYSCHTDLIWKSRAFNYCTYCHFDNVPSGYSKYFSWRHTGAGLYGGYNTFENIEKTRHPINDKHLSTTKDCIKCHSRILTDEHFRPESHDNLGKRINCDTCHTSVEPKVREAITKGNTACTACHLQTDHEAVHISGLNSNCQTCHKDSLTGEHLNNSTTTGRNYNCNTCHANTTKEIKRTITVKNLNCSGCHQKAHGIALADNVPADIPLYSGFQWIPPQEASIFIGDSTTPAGYEAGQMILSNRRKDISIDQIWNFYNQQLSAKGWKIKTGVPAPGSPFFTAEFEKNNRRLTLKGYNTVKSDGTGETLNSGYRIEIWY